MPNLDKKWFREKGDIPSDIADKLFTPSFGPAMSPTLVNLGWQGNHIATVGLYLSPDNRHVHRARFLLMGPLTRETIHIQATKLFPATDPEITLTITLPDSTNFLFSGGTLCSDFMPWSAYKLHYSKGDTIIFPTDWQANHLGETCIRAICHLDKSSNGNLGPRLKTTTLLFPKSVEEMSQLSDGTQSAAWPGLRILQTIGEFFPKTGAWKDPFLPLLLQGSSRTDAPNLPTGDEIRFYISAVMRSAKLPTACTTATGLGRQWARALNEVEILEKDPTITWPSLPRPAAPAGRNLNLLLPT